MARTTATAVEGILEESPSLTLTPFITTANRMVTKHCSEVSDYTSDDLEEIERYLAAHLYHVAATRADSEKAGTVGETKRSKVDMGLNLTHYGQHAMLLDWNGGLAALNARTQKGIGVAFGLTWIGEEEEELEDD
jgi:hypothetical protein